MDGLESEAAVRIDDGVCRVFFAYDVGHTIDLDAAARRVGGGAAERGALRPSRRSPAYLQFRPLPLRLDQSIDPVAVGDFHTDPGVELTVFDFGAVSIGYRLPLAGRALAELLPLAAALYQCEPLRIDARARVAALAEQLRPAVLRPGLAELVEDYTVYALRHWSDEGGGQGPDRDSFPFSATRELLAQILRAEPAPLSEQEVVEATAYRLSYGLRDLTVIDWNAAIVVDEEAEETLAVLEFANVELLEMRFLDDRLDGVLDRSYASLSEDTRAGWRLRGTRDQRRRLAVLHMDAALLFEGINNAIKLVGDQYLARVYRLAARRFHLPDWDASILRKLDTVQRLYEKLSDDQATRRMEVLEWIIIILIAVSIVLPFVPGTK